ncbi:MAG TPA: MFS transporter, partial [Chloroflexi bacterium]|nr:MFS transporter [Chloroflexota bacterium]HCG29212.1 MFS transporter [Chloroflexota bacterium]
MAAVIKASWLPMVIIALAQIQLGFNVNALTISMGAIVEDLQVPPAMVGTALVVYSLAVAGLVMLGAKIGRMIGSRLAFQIGIAAQAAAMAVMALAFNAELMLLAQAIAGIAAALAVPAFVVMIANYYHAAQQEQSLGLLGAAQASSSALAFLVVGFMSMVVSWRWAFAMLVVVGAIIVILSFRLEVIEPRKGIRIDWLGAILAA